MNVLLTGGYGFIGQHTAERLYKEGCRLTLIDRDINKQKNKLKIKHTSYQLNPKDAKCEDVFKSGHFDAVVFLEETEANGQNAYADGLINILSLAVKYKVRNFVFISDLDLDQSESAHAMGQRMIEEYCMNTAKLQGINCVGLRVDQVYGPKDYLYPKENWVNNVINKVIKEEEFTITSDRTAYLTYVEDAADAVYKAMNYKKSELFDLISDEPLTQYELANNFSEIASVKIKGDKQKAAESDSDSSYPANEKAANNLQWHPKYFLKEGLKKTLDWYRNTGVIVKETEPSSNKHTSFKMISILPYLENIMFFLIVFLIHYHTRENLDRYSVFPMDLNVIYIFTISIIYGMKQGFLAVLLAGISYVYVYFSVSPDIASILYNKGHIIQLLIYLAVAIVSSFAIDNKKREIINLKGNFKLLKDEFDYIQRIHEDTVHVKNELHAQILNADNSIGTIYSLTKALNSLQVEDLFSGAVSILEKLLKTRMISIYTVNQNKSFLRLVAKSRKLGKEISNSIDIDKNLKLKEVILGKEIFINREIIPEIPVMIAPIVCNNEVAAVIFVHETAFENLNLYYENFFKVSVELIASAFSQALSYEKAIHADKFAAGTKIMNPDYFEKTIESKNKAKALFDIEYAILKITRSAEELDVKDREEQLLKFSQTIESYIRETDYIGMDGKGQLYIILSNSNEAMSTIVAQRLEKSGLSAVLCSKVEK